MGKTFAMGLCGTLLAACATTTSEGAPAPALASQPKVAATVLVDELVKQRRYESAFKHLAEQDPGNASPDVVLKKIEVATGYFAMTINYELFAFKDLGPGEDLMALRKGAPADLKMYNLDVPKVLAPLMAKYPADHRLAEALGNYHYERMVRFPGMRADPQLAIASLQKAAENGAASASSLARLGNCLLMQDEPDQALKRYEAALAKAPDDPSTSYNAAAIYLHREQLDKALPLARKAFDLYGRPERAQGEDAELVPRRRSEAIRMVGMIQAMKEDLAAARGSFQEAIALNPDDPNARRFQADVELKLGLKDAAVATAGEAIAHEPHDLEAYGRLIGVFDHYQALPELRALFESLLPRYGDDADVQGTLHFFAGEVCFAQEDPASARAHYEQARAAFLKAAPDHPALKVLDEAMARLPEAEAAKAKPAPKPEPKKRPEPKASPKK